MLFSERLHSIVTIEMYMCHHKYLFPWTQQLMQRALRLATLLQQEYLLTPPCAQSEDRLSQALDNLVDMGLLQASVFPQVCI